jgi:hypothetical protein
VKVDRDELRLVACHAWDVTGARAAGRRAAFVRRPGKALDPGQTAPDVVGVDLASVVTRILAEDVGRARRRELRATEPPPAVRPCAIGLRARELVLRTTSLVRRLTRVLPDVNAVLTAERITLNTGSQEVVVDGRLVELTPREFLRLRLLMTHPGRLFTRRQLLDLLWDGRKPGTRALDMHVYRLREKLGAASDQIDTVRAEGYRLRRPRPKKATG